jgi:hypothetical protein
MNLALQTANQETRQVLLDLASSWSNLAAELESASALLKAIDAINEAKEIEPV